MHLPIPNANEVAEFKQLYREHRGIELSDQEALDMATRFLIICYFGMTTPPGITGEQYELLKKRTEHNREQKLERR